jgi:hypothetical protein
MLIGRPGRHQLGGLSRHVIGIGAGQVGDESRYILRRLRPAKGDAPDELLVARSDFCPRYLGHDSRPLGIPHDGRPRTG